MSAAAVLQADRIQAVHRDDGEGWCEFDLKHHSVRVKFGQCDAYVRAAVLKELYAQQSAPTSVDAAVRFWSSTDPKN